MTNPFGLIIQCDFSTIHDLEMAAEAAQITENRWIWIKGDDSEISSNLTAINQLIKTTKLNVFCQSKFLIEQGLSAVALIIEDFKEIAELKKNHSKLLIGGIAADLAKSKNFELFKGDFIFLGPIDEIGENPYITLIPEKPDYEWRFIDITIPVIGFGIIDAKELKEFSKTVDFSGFICKIQDFQKYHSSQLRFPTF